MRGKGFGVRHGTGSWRCWRRRRWRRSWLPPRGQAREVREELGRILRQIGAVGMALAEWAEGTRRLLVEAVVVLGGEFDELRWMLAETHGALLDVQRLLIVQNSQHRQHLDLTRQASVTILL